MHSLILNSMRPIHVISKRNFETLFRWLTPVFNQVNKERIAKWGPDLACAEWLMRNGAAVRWLGSSDYVNNYNALFNAPSSTSSPLSEVDSKHFISGVDATDSSISQEGFPYFTDCKHIEEVKLVNCKYIGNGALSNLDLLKNSLKYLEIINCPRVTDEGLINLRRLLNLKNLKLSNLPSVEDKLSIEQKLRLSLENCNISID
ncbi:ATP synthase subunit s, mitochondrial [Chelonus insularis]|uniref:ATP synthase subunit s, mitochondrial n=1 Tax=Chelonus insularis TaxID=460826 RepID=UPI00158F5BD9|nr:ATP synthase subunit s, mitochondrial [Chelonus insularis]